jgi:hypothetical protein
MRLKLSVSDNIKIGITEFECERCSLISLIIWKAEEMRRHYPEYWVEIKFWEFLE